MSNNEIENYIATLDKGLEEAEREMLKNKASHNESVVIADKNGTIRDVPAKEILAECC